MPQEFDYFPCYPHRLLGSMDVRKMDNATFGAYWRLLCESFNSNPQGYLPDDEEDIRILAQMSATEWEKAREKLLKKFPLRNRGKRGNPTLLQIISELRAARRKRAKAGRTGAKVRWGNDDNANGNAITRRDAIAPPKNSTKPNQTKLNQRVGREPPPAPPPPPPENQDPGPPPPPADAAAEVLALLAVDHRLRRLRTRPFAAHFAERIPRTLWHTAVAELVKVWSRPDAGGYGIGYAKGVLETFLDEHPPETAPPAPRPLTEKEILEREIGAAITDEDYAEIQRVGLEAWANGEEASDAVR